jgi:DNA polymerase-3 subunit epsilon
MENLKLDRPLAFFDLETTGIDPGSDKIVEIAVLRIEPDGSRETRTRRINPGRPIPAGATAVHGIRDEDVRDEPGFAQIARSLLHFLEGADLAGFNVRRFDLPLLDREFMECGLDLQVADRRVVDAMVIFHRQERRDLSAAVRLYLGKELEGAHGAEADIEATAAVLDAQLARYDDLPRDVGELDLWTRRNPDEIDSSGKFRWRDGEVVFAFGKHDGKTLREVARRERGYLEWLTGTSMASDALQLVRRALAGNVPSKSAPDQSA